MFTRLTRLATTMHHVLWTLPDKAVLASSPGNELFALFLPSKVREYELPSHSELPELYERVIKQGSFALRDKWHLGLPLECFSIINFSLPQAAAQDLDQAVRYALMRHVPFDLASTYRSYRVLENGKNLEIAAVVAQKEKVDPVLQVFARAGLTVSSIFPSLVFYALSGQDGAYLQHGPGRAELVVKAGQRIPLQMWFRPAEHESDAEFADRAVNMLQNLPDKPKILYLRNTFSSEMQGLRTLRSVFDEVLEQREMPGWSVKELTAKPYSLDMLPPSIRQQEKMAQRMQVGAFVFLLLCLLSFPAAELMGTKHYLSRLNQRIAQVQQTAQELQSIREENRELMAFFEKVAQKVQGQPQAAVILKEMTEVIPQTAWLYSFQYSEGSVRIQGEAESATAILEALENSPLFQEAQYASPVQKSGSRDRFKIVAQVVL